MPKNYECPRCKSRTPVAVGDKILCVKCGAEMKPVLLYSEIIWPSRKKLVQEQLNYSVEETSTLRKLIKELETRRLPVIESQTIRINIPMIKCRDVYELKQRIELLEKEFVHQLRDHLELEEIRKELRNREVCMSTLSTYTKTSEHPAKQYSMTIKYLKKRIEEKDDPVLRSILAKLEIKKEEYEKKWIYRTPVSV